MTTQKSNNPKRSMIRSAKKIVGLAAVMLFSFGIVYAQSPYGIPPKWYFGMRAGMDFSGGAPVVMSGGQTGTSTPNPPGQEGSSTMCDPAGNVVFYSDSRQLFDGTNTFVQLVNGGTSSTTSSVCFPDPADPANQFYFVTANQDPGGGGNFGTLGMYYYRIQKSGPTITVSAPTLLAANNEVTEQICVGSDGNGGYWVVTHQGGGNNGNQIWSWNFTASGVGTKQVSSAGGENNISYNGSVKINRCQNRIAFAHRTGRVDVFNWDQSTGMVTGLLRTTSPGGFIYGCEFSPDGNVLYFTDLVGNTMYKFDLASGTVTNMVAPSSNNNTEMGTLQLGPDNKIYVTNVGNLGQPAYIGVINDPNNFANPDYSSTGFLLNNSVGFYPNIYRGIANEPWVNPTLTIDTAGACRIINFSYDFLTYYGSQNIAVQAGSEEWDFGDGGGFQTGLGATPQHTYATGGTYTITLRVNDATCGNRFTISRTINVNGCSTPPPTCTYTINASAAAVSNITVDESTTETASLDGSGSTFDAAGTEPHQYYWMIGTPDTNSAFSENATTSLDFTDNGAGSSYPPGSYTIYLVIRQGLCLDTTIVTFDVNYVPTPCITLDAKIKSKKQVFLDGSNPVTVNFDGTSSVWEPSSPNPQEYFWIEGSDFLNTFSTNPTSSLTFAYNGAGGNLPQGQYDIYLVIRDGSCLDTAHIVLDVTHFFIPNLVTPNDDKINDEFDITNTSGLFDVQIFNRWGDKVYEEKGYTHGWNLTNVSDGIYYFSIVEAESQEQHKGWVQIVR